MQGVVQSSMEDATSCRRLASSVTFKKHKIAYTLSLGRKRGDSATGRMPDRVQPFIYTQSANSVSNAKGQHTVVLAVIPSYFEKTECQTSVCSDKTVNSIHLRSQTNSNPGEKEDDVRSNPNPTVGSSDSV